MKFAWNSEKTGFEESLHYLQGRQVGKIKSIRTPWPKVDDAMVAGMEWHSTIVIGGRPGSGKTLIGDQIVNNAFPLNPNEDFRVLKFSFEMVARASAIREYSSVLGRSYKYLCSAEGTLSNEDLQRCYAHAKKKVEYPIDIVETPCTVKDFKKIIKQYMDYHGKTIKDETGEITDVIYPKVIITVDHSLLFKKGPDERDKYEMLYNLGEALTELKRRFPIIFIVLSQLNRNIDNPDRNEDGKYSNYVLESDIFGADALLQHADVVIGINRPAKQKIRFYGPDRFIIENDRVLALHFLKCRNGDTRVSFFEGEFEKMRVKEIPTPPRQERRISTT
jgi:replicative DNA helicase